LVPREHQYGEHVDDHQRQIAAQLAARGLAVSRDASQLQLDDVLAAARRTVVRSADPPPLRLALSGALGADAASGAR
jgi:UDP-N-acetylglucosamine transferase subunit ALG13